MAVNKKDELEIEEEYVEAEASAAILLRMQVDNLSLEVEKQHTTIMQLQSQNLQLMAIVQNHGRFLSAGEDDYDLLAAENRENLREYIRSTIHSDAYISVGTVKLEGLSDD